MKKRALLTACALVLAIAGVTVAKANANFATFYYTVSGVPGCASTSTLSGCTTQNTGTLCTSGDFTYYQNASCTSPFYKML